MGRDEWMADRKTLREQRRLKREWDASDGPEDDVENSPDNRLRTSNMKKKGDRYRVFRDRKKASAYVASTEFVADVAKAR